MNQDDHNTPKIGCVNHDCDKCKAQQPVAYVYEREVDGFGLRKDVKFLKPVEVGSDLYTSPPQRNPLTDEEIDKLPWGPHEGNPMTFAEGLRDFARAIEAAHGIKGDA